VSPTPPSLEAAAVAEHLGWALLHNDGGKKAPAVCVPGTEESKSPNSSVLTPSSVRVWESSGLLSLLLGGHGPHYWSRSRAGNGPSS
jgi:hypothetical protein